MKREEIEKLAKGLARDLSALCRRKPDPYGAEEILRFAANASSWREFMRQYGQSRELLKER